MQMLLNNRYRIIRTLGSGGFGETFLAEDTQMPSNRCCVIKQLKPIHHNPQVYKLVQQRFQREAAILEELGGSSDQIPALYAYFQLEELFYLVQEWVEGETLTAKFRQQGVFTESTVREILVSLLPVLEYVHSKHIVHRDIKPDNIILRHRDGKPVLIDFGAVRETMGTVLNSQGSSTNSIVIGTPGYMPREQAMGRPVYVSDLYSLGITAIYLLTGKQPQELEIDSHTGEILWHSYALNVSPTFAVVIDRAIAYHPRHRYSSATAMLEAMIPSTQPPLTQKKTVSTPSPETEMSTPPPAKGNSKNSMIVGGAIAAGLIGTSVIVLTKPSQQVAQQTVSPHQNIATSKLTPTNQSIPPVTTTTVNEYFWLSQRSVTDTDLDGKSDFDLDIMRNSIFARQGRRFKTPGLQSYFNNKLWYHPRYTPNEFDKLKLLSDLEQKNVAYIAAYQDRYNRRYFPK